MKIKFLQLESFRNILRLEMVPCENINIIYGDNAQGKTNLIESIWLLSGAKSFRAAKDADLISFGKDFSQIEAKFSSENRPQDVKIRIEKKKSVWLNDIKKSSAADLAGVLPTVVFSPSHLGLVQNGPAGRRRFLDTSICQIYPRYIYMINRYQRVLFQRNSLLKDVNRSPSLFETLDVWDERLAFLGCSIVRIRKEYIERLKHVAVSVYGGISMEKEVFSLVYNSSFLPYENGDIKIWATAVKEEINKKRREDLQKGTTSLGPHRDDLEIFIDNKNVRVFGSQGQQRSSVLALKMAESRCIQEILKEKPVVLLDDVMSELDQSRRSYLLKHLQDSQIFITCCDKDSFSQLENGQVFKMKEGCLFKD